MKSGCKRAPSATTVWGAAEGEVCVWEKRERERERERGSAPSGRAAGCTAEGVCGRGERERERERKRFRTNRAPVEVSARRDLCACRE